MVIQQSNTWTQQLVHYTSINTMSNLYPRLWDQLALSNLPQDDMKLQPKHIQAVNSNINTGQAPDNENRARD